MGNFLARYTSRVVIYDRRAFIRLATGLFLVYFGDHKSVNFHLRLTNALQFFFFFFLLNVGREATLKNCCKQFFSFFFLLNVGATLM